MNPPKKILYNSNFSLEEQIYFIETYLSKNAKEIKRIDMFILNTSYEGFQYDEYLFLKEGGSSKNIKIIKNIIDINPFLWIFEQLNKLKIHRNFFIEVKKETLKISDILRKETKIFNNSTNNSLYLFSFDSRFFSIFKLNKKTMSNKSKFIRLDKEHGFLLIRKNKRFLLLKTLD